MSRPSIFRYTLLFLVFFFQVKRLAFIRGNFASVSSLYSQNSKKIYVFNSATVWFRFRIGRHLLQNEYRNYDCLGKIIVGYDDEIYRFTGTLSFRSAHEFWIKIGAEDAVRGRVRRCTLPLKRGATLRQVRKMSVRQSKPGTSCD